MCLESRKEVLKLALLVVLAADGDLRRSACSNTYVVAMVETAANSRSEDKERIILKAL